MVFKRHSLFTGFRLVILTNILLFSFCFSSLTAQDFSLELDIKVEKNNKKLEGAIVTLLKGSTQISQNTTPASGKTAFTLEPNGDYTVTVSKPGHITKRFFISTKNVPAERAKE